MSPVSSQPSTQRLAAGLRAAQVALHQRRAAHPETSDAALGQRRAAGAPDLDREAGERGAHGDQFRALSAARIDLARAAGVSQGLRIEVASGERAVQSGEGDGETRFGETVDRREGFRAQAPAAEARVEASHHVGRDGLRPVERHAPAREVDAVELVVRDALEAEAVGEVRGRRHHAAVARDGPQPECRPGHEELGRNQRQLGCRVLRREHAADEPHVVVERQPGHAARFGASLPVLVERSDLGEDRPMGQCHGLGIDRRAGGELHEGEVIRLRCAERRFRRRRVRRQAVESRELERAAAARDHLAEQSGDRRLRDEQSRPDGRQHLRRARVVFLEPSEPYRGVERDGHGTRGEHAEERVEERGRGAEHEADPVAGSNAELEQPAAGAQRATAYLVPTEKGGALAPVDEAQPATPGRGRSVQQGRQGLNRHRAPAVAARRRRGGRRSCRVRPRPRARCAPAGGSRSR